MDRDWKHFYNLNEILWVENNENKQNNICI